MKKQENSLALMQKMDAAIQNVQDIKQQINILKNEIETKLKILNQYRDVTTSMVSGMRDLEERTRKQDIILFALDSGKFMGDAFSSYGHTIHPKLAGLSDQMFNFMTHTGPLFKDNVTVQFRYEVIDDGEESPKTVTLDEYQYCDLLKHEADSTKKDVFIVFPTNKVTMRIEMRPTDIIGNIYCNMIEICPYLSGTFTIDEIRGWTVTQYRQGELEENVISDTAYQAGPFTNVGPERIQLDQRYPFYRIEFDFTIEPDQAGTGFPFGLRHLYFYNANIDMQNSFVICEIDKGEDYIGSIGNNITFITPEGKKQQPVPNDMFYALYDNGVLQGSLQPGPLARNLTKVYAKIPVTEPIKGVLFHDIEIR